MERKLHIIANTTERKYNIENGKENLFIAIYIEYL